MHNFIFFATNGQNKKTSLSFGHDTRDKSYVPIPSSAGSRETWTANQVRMRLCG